jgi:CRISPR-associated protein Csh1
MLKELVQFTEAAAELKEIGTEPKHGLYICLRLEETVGHWSINAEKAKTLVYTGKDVDSPELLKKYQDYVKNAWMIDTNKCLDAPEKAIHSCSPYMVAFKKESLQKGKKDSLAQRLNRYFLKAYEYLADVKEKARLDVFKNLLNSDDRLLKVLGFAQTEFDNLKDKHYVFILLDEELDKYQVSHKRYLTEKLFNTSEYNISLETGEAFGTSGFFNGFPIKKPFLVHRTAPFSISGRISLEEAQALFDFEILLKNKPPLLPNPLPIFVISDERTDSSNSIDNIRKRVFKIFEDDARSGGEKRKPYLKIIEELWEDFSGEVGNYYLILTGIHQKEKVIRDFDFVSRFEFNLEHNGSPWEVPDIFKYKDSKPDTLQNIAQLAAILPDFFNSQMIFKWFDDLESKYFKKPNNHQLVMKYRKAFYDFIYKSQRQSVTQNALYEILMTGVMDDITSDRQENEGINIRRKLNLLFSLYQYFYPKIKHPFLMATKIEELRQQLDAVARGDAHLNDDDDHLFAFAAGQVISRIYMQSETANRTFKYAEPFLRQTKADRFVKNIEDFFVRYSHKPYSKRFTTVSAEVMSYPYKSVVENFDNLKPLVLAGIFYRRNLLLSEEEKTNDDGTQVTETPTN